MTRTPDPQIALAAALDLPDGEGAPAEVHLLPNGPVLTTFDGRGPYKVGDLQRIIAASRTDRFQGELPIDENHAIDLKAPAGGSSEARGWITELQARADGIWAKVRWTAEGERMVAGRSYRGLSPVFAHDAQGNVRAILRAALTNTPNLKGLIALNQETQVTFSAPKLAAAVGLKPEATEDEILAALPKPDTALQSAMVKIAAAVKVDATDPAKVAAAVEAGTVALAAQGEQSQTLTALQAQLADLEKKDKRRTSEAWLADQVAKKRGVAPKDREYFITLHMEHPDVAERMIGYARDLGDTHAGGMPPAADGEVALNAEQRHAARVLGIPEADYLATLKSERETAQ
jgi:phage I-like protein